MTGRGRPKAAPKKRANGAATHYVDPRNGRHIVQGTIPGVGRRKVRADNEGEAWAAFEQLRKDAERYDLAAKDSTVGQLAEAWLHNYERGHAETSTRSVRAPRIRLHIVNDPIGRHRADKLTPGDVEAWLLGKVRAGWRTPNGSHRPYSESSVYDFRRDLSQIIDWAVARRVVEWNPVKHIDKVRIESETKPKRTLTVEQAAHLVRECAGSERRNAVYVLAVLSLGARPGEIAALTWDRINFDTGEVRIDRAMKRRTGGVPVALGDTKTKLHRTLNAPTFLLDALADERKRQDEERHPEWPEEWDGLVFRSRLGNPPNRSNLLKSLRQIMDDAGLAGMVIDLTNYELRHSCASLLDHLGVPVNDIIDQLGWTDDRMFYKHYRHKVDPVSGKAGAAAWATMLGD